MATQAQLSYPAGAIGHSEGSVIARLFATDNAWSSLVLRVALGLVIFPHGAQKLLGWFGGHGFAGTMGFFTETMHLPAVIAFLVILGESVGAVLLVAGFMTRFVALSLATIMVGAIALVHWPYGFFMNWFGQQPGEGFEFHLLVIAISAALVLSGGGRWSVDRKLGRAA
jgi:putative oxidoreductase